MRAFASLAQQVDGAAADDIDAVIDEAANRFCQAELARLTQAVGVQGPKALAMATALRDIVIPWEAARTVFKSTTLPAEASKTNAALANCAALPALSFGALVSLTYNRGPSYHAAGDRYTEMRGIADAMAAQNFEAIPPLIRAMTRIWVGTTIEHGMTNRRTAEADLFARGLAGNGGAIT